MKYDKAKADQAIREMIKATAAKLGLTEAEYRRRLKRVAAAERPRAKKP